MDCNVAVCVNNWLFDFVLNALSIGRVVKILLGRIKKVMTSCIK